MGPRQIALHIGSWAVIGHTAGILQAQTPLFTEDFEGTTSAFTLNTMDVGSTPNGDNTWVINDVYPGGNGDIICLGFPFSYTIITTPAQPAGITSQNGRYMHTASVEGIADGIENCSFAAADGLCIASSNHFTRMNTDVSTIGQTGVNFRFWWLCAGGTNTYGEVYYSTNGGTTWTLVTSPIPQYNNTPGWVYQQIIDPAFDGQTTLRFGFRFVSGVSTIAADPGFGIDDVEIVAGTSTPASIGLPPFGYAYCDNAAATTLPVSYTLAGTFNAGNLFIAELSDAFGSFTAPMSLASVMSTTAIPINVPVPFGVVAGNGYRIRVVSTDPPVIGPDNGSDISVVEAPDAGLNAQISICKATGFYDLFSLLNGQPDVGGTWTGPGGVSFGGQFDSAIDPAGVFTYTVPGQAPCASASASVTVMLVDAAWAGNDGADTLCIQDPLTDLFTYLGGTPQFGGIWYNPLGMAFNGILDPGTGASGTFTYVVPGTSVCPDDSSTVTISIENCSAIGGAGAALLQLQLLGGHGQSLQWVNVEGLAHGELQFAIFDNAGRLARSWTVDHRGSGSYPLGLQGLGPGIYQLMISSGTRSGRLSVMVSQR